MTDDGNKNPVPSGTRRERHPVWGWHWKAWVQEFDHTWYCDHRHKHGHEARACAKERANAVTGS